MISQLVQEYLDSDTKLSQTKVERTIKDVGLTPDQIQINGNDNKQATVQFKMIYLKMKL